MTCSRVVLLDDSSQLCLRRVLTNGPPQIPEVRLPRDVALLMLIEDVEGFGILQAIGSRQAIALTIIRHGTSTPSPLGLLSHRS